MNINRVLENNRLIKALTGLSIIEFNELAKLFAKELLIIKQRKRDRKRAIGGGRRGILPDHIHKLFYILFYFKVYPTFDMASFVFNTSRSKTCEWVKKYQPVLEQSLKKALVLPKRKISTPEELYQLIPSIKDLLIDGVERKALRAKKPKTAAKRYSGKKKMHTRKNIVCCDDKRRILFLSKSKNGKLHDKKALDKTGLPEILPHELTVWVDKGFRGIDKRCKSKIMMPKHNSKKNPLTKLEKANNAVISGIRMTVEHAINGIKRFGVIANPFRNKNGSDDKFTELCSGLWNWHLNFIN
jgi:DDE superfamily endonuclease/Helix-turn-helix of DDE superfamily endonuclease